jgi:hypothetical protein
MRDDPMDAPIPDTFEADDYYEKTAARAKSKLAELESMTIEQAAALLNAEHEEAIGRTIQGNIKIDAMLARYSRMRAKVETWAPPTKEHDGFKRFMLEQIDESTKYIGRIDMPQAPDPATWLADRIALAKRDIERGQEKHAEQIARAKERTDWVRALKASLR